MDTADMLGFGVFKPVGHVVISFPSAGSADAAAQALASMGVHGDLVRRYTDRQMLTQIDHDLEHTVPQARLGQALKLVRQQRDMAELGYHWIVVRASDDAQAAVVTACVRPFGAARAQHHGSHMVEELIEP